MLGKTLGSYRVGGKLGEGGMGVVYWAEHPLLERKAAIKLLLPEFSKDPDMVRRFFDEARATTLIKHPGLVDVFDFGTHEDGSAFIVMELLEGETLAARLRRGRLPSRLAAQLARQLCSALAAAHGAGIVHRDLKPDNVFLLPDRDWPGGQRVKVLDFGIAKLLGVHSDRMKTRTGTLIGTPTYMAPEQCRGTGTIDGRADLYAIGCILFELVCGRPPFDGDGVGDIIAAHLKESPPRPRELEPSVPSSLEALILWMLEKRADDRPQQLDEVIADLDRMLAVTVPGPEVLADVAPQRAPPGPPLLDEDAPLELARPARSEAPTVVARGANPTGPTQLAAPASAEALTQLEARTLVGPRAAARAELSRPAPPPPPDGALARLREQLAEPWKPFSRIGIIVALSAFGLFMLLILASEPGWVPVLDSANLAFHEAGHPAFGIFGDGPNLYGGTLGQLFFPFVAMATFFVRRQPRSFAFAGVWLCENFLNIARYMADARAQELPLVGGGEHDWLHIFRRWDALHLDTQVASVTRWLGWGGMLLCVGWLVWRWRADERAGRMASPEAM